MTLALELWLRAPKLRADAEAPHPAEEAAKDDEARCRSCSQTIEARMTLPLTDERLQEIRALEQKATPKPWAIGTNAIIADKMWRNRKVTGVLGPKDEHVALCGFAKDEMFTAPLANQTLSDSAFIVAARNILPDVLDRLAAAEREVAALRGLLQEAMELLRHTNTQRNSNGRYICQQCGAGDSTATHINHYAHCQYKALAKDVAASGGRVLDSRGEG